MKQLLALLLFISAALAAHGACSSAKDGGGNWISVVQQAHQMADDSPRDAVRAERQLRWAIARAPEAPNESERWIIQDLHYRLAQLLADTGDSQRAFRDLEAGLRFSDSPTLARANLLALQGKLLQQRGETEAASAAYHAALLINEGLMDQALAGSSQEPGQP